MSVASIEPSAGGLGAFNCTEYCSPTGPCKGCEMPMLRSLLRQARLLMMNPDNMQDRADWADAVEEHLTS